MLMKGPIAWMWGCAETHQGAPPWLSNAAPTVSSAPASAAMATAPAVIARIVRRHGVGETCIVIESTPLSTHSIEDQL